MCNRCHGLGAFVQCAEGHSTTGHLPVTAQSRGLIAAHILAQLATEMDDSFTHAATTEAHTGVRPPGILAPVGAPLPMFAAKLFVRTRMSTPLRS